ncbi:MAG: cation diffusion facilitator family transporter [bacterium]
MRGPDTEPRDRDRRLDAAAASRVKREAIRTALAAAALQAAAKGVVGLLTGSLAVLALALDSFSDFLNVAIARIAVAVAGRPPDREHPFGHGKVEPLGALLQAFVMMPLAALLVWQGVRRMVEGGEVVGTLGAAAVLVLSVLLGLWTARMLDRAAGHTDSLALQGSGLSFRIDAVTHAAVILGLVTVEATGAVAVDALLSIAVALYVSLATLRLAWKAGGDLLDLQVGARYRERVIMELEEHRDEFLGYHRLRTRRAGPEKHIDLHLTICRFRTLEEAHRLADHLENAIEAIIPQSQVIIHVDPCQEGETCVGEAVCELARDREGAIPESDWPEHPTGPEARREERRQHPYPRPGLPGSGEPGERA